jgi:hypothetical protein
MLVINFMGVKAIHGVNIQKIIEKVSYGLIYTSSS